MADDTGQPQNIYDDVIFFAGYSTLERFGAGWEQAMEHDDLLALLPALAGRRALDLGCGAGQLAHYLAVSGATEVIGVDLSERMLALARADWAHPHVLYERASMEQVTFPAARFDLVVSSLAFHYVDDYAGLVRRIVGWLVPGGVLVFSTEHPIFTARLPPTFRFASRGAERDDGWVYDAHGQRARYALDDYAEEGPRQEHWFVPGVRKVHRTLATLINGLIDAGLTLERIVEPVPTADRLRTDPAARDERRRPMFVLIRARKPAR